MISLRPTRALPALLALALAGLAAPTASADRGDVQSIFSARRAALDTTVTVRGTVSVQSNAFDAGFAIQQGAAGIYVLDSGGVARALGDQVEVTGTLVDNFGLLSIRPTAITARGRGDKVEPRALRTGAIGEATEGRLFELEGDMVGDLIDDGVFGFKLNIDDGSGPVQLFLFPGSHIATDGLREGVSIKVTCFSSQFETHFECDPRQPRDFRVRRRGRD